MIMKYFITGLLLWVCSVVTAQIMLPAYHGAFNNKAQVINSASNGLDFDGVDDYVDCGVNANLNIVSSMTIELWIKPNQNMGSGKWDRLVHRDWGTGYFFGGKAGVANALAVALSGNLNAAVTPANTVVVGVWQHVAFVFDDPANTIKIYKDGAIISTSTWTGSITGDPNSTLTLSQSSETFNGVMDEVRIWNVARTQDEIQANMNKELLGNETGLVAYYPFNQGVAAGDNSSINTVLDITSNGFNGSLNNFAKSGITSNFVVGKLKQSVQIGTQTWMTRNATVETYRNGDVIPQVTDNATWNNLTTGAWCYYANTSSNGTVYGKLYNWYAVHDSRNLAPAGWHVPTDAEFTTLQTYLGGSSVAGGKLMMSGSALWPSPNSNSTNSSGFDGLPGGYRLPSGGFNSGGDWAVFWSYDDGTTYDWQLRSNNAAFNHYPDPKTFGFSVRFIKDAIPTSGLVLQLDAGNTVSYPGSGTTWTDLSGNNNNGTFISGVSYSNSNGGTMVFNGSSNNRVQTNLTTSFTDFTVGIWYKDAGSQAFGRLMDKDFANGFWLGRNAGAANSWGGGILEPGGPYGIFITLTDAQWHFIVSVRSGTTHTIYGDGVTNKASNTVGNGALNSTSIALGGWSGGGTASQVLTGNLSQVYVYSRALTEAEILQIFNATRAKYGL